VAFGLRFRNRACCPASGRARLVFYLDKDGKKQDAALHEEMLNNPEADKWAREASKQRARERGVSEETIELMYPED
jgi:hypothetical protein